MRKTRGRIRTGGVARTAKTGFTENPSEYKRPNHEEKEKNGTTKLKRGKKTPASQKKSLLNRAKPLGAGRKEMGEAFPRNYR